MESEPQPPTPSDHEPEWNPHATMIYPAAAVRRKAQQKEPRPIVVEVLGGPMDGARRRIPSALFTIGRAPDNQLSLPLDPTVSTRHACIHGDGEQFWLEDLNSSNGTFVGEKRLTERILIGPGATFRVGHTVIEFMPR